MNSYKDYQNARDLSWKVLIENDVRALPVKIVPICWSYGIRVRSYQDNAEILRKLNLTQMIDRTDGFLMYISGEPVIFYDKRCTEGRQRFTIGHELGHYLLGHVKPGQVTIINREPEPGDSPAERQANQFAARILAPACVLWGLDLHDADEIAAACGISKQAAAFRAERMRVLYQRGKFLTAPEERRVYSQFENFISQGR